VEEWGISEEERNYIDRQQGTICNGCGSNIRSIVLAKAITDHWLFAGNFEEFVARYAGLNVLEINEASSLTRWLEKMPNRTLARYPEVDMHQMPYSDGAYDLVVHSDTLEHVADPVRALMECRRVLRSGGLLAFTVPVIIGRLTKSRKGLPPSFHGYPETAAGDYLVHTEYGADMWQHVIQAGFDRVQINTFDFPAGIAVSASLGAPHGKKYSQGIISKLFKRS
jgi:SAM-dependent methyltransferase